MNLLFVNDRRGAWPPSLHAQSAVPSPQRPRLTGARQAQVCVVGGGYTGLSAALHLARRGIDVVLLEAHRVGFGASGRNGGQVGTGQRLVGRELVAAVGETRARAMWNMAEEAKALVRDLAAAMPGTDYAPGVALACRTGAEAAEAGAEAEFLHRAYGYDRIEPLDRGAFRALVPSPAYAGGLLDHGAGHLHPLNYAIGLAADAEAAGAVIHEGSWVAAIDHARTPGGRSLVRTAVGSVSAEHVILAGNGYLGALDRRVSAHVMPINNYIIATEPLGDRATGVLTRNIAVHDTRFVVNYWRLSPDRRLVFGGGESVTYRFPRDIAAKVRPAMLRVYPQLADVAITHAWGGTLAITRSRLPHFTRPAPNCLSASGYSGHGLALATHAGRLMAEAVAGGPAGFDLMAGLPQHAFPGGAALRWPLLVAGMAWFGLRDRLGR